MSHVHSVLLFRLQNYEKIRKSHLRDLRIYLPILLILKLLRPHGCNLAARRLAAAPQKPQKFLKVRLVGLQLGVLFSKVRRAGLQLGVFFSKVRLAVLQLHVLFSKVHRAVLQLDVFKTFGRLAALQRHAPKTFGRRDALGGQQAEGDRPFHRYVGEYS